MMNRVVRYSAVAGVLMFVATMFTGCSSAGPQNVGKDKWVINAYGTNLSNSPLAAAIGDMVSQASPICPHGFNVLAVKDKDFHNGAYLTSYRFRALINCNPESKKSVGCGNCDDGFHDKIIKTKVNTVEENF